MAMTGLQISSVKLQFPLIAEISRFSALLLFKEALVPRSSVLVPRNLDVSVFVVFIMADNDTKILPAKSRDMVT